MTVLIIVVLLVVGFVFAILLGIAMKNSDDSGALLCLFFSPIFIGMGAVITYGHGTGELSIYRLEHNAIYETVSSTPDNGKYAVILREQDGSLSAYLMDQNPPKMFKVTGVDAKTFEPFPPVSPVPSVPSKK
mgnify:CR=1 FL=1